MIIKVEQFKGIESGEVELDDITVFVGTNNAGKSSFIQAIQFAVSGCQTLELKSIPWRNSGNYRTTSLNSEEFLYTPTRNIETLYHRERMTESTGKIQISFTDNGNTSIISFGKGRNKGIATKLINKAIGDLLCSIQTPFCVYVPGIAGIPIEEIYEPEIKVRKSAIRGDSNNFLRNILLRIKRDSNNTKWVNLLHSLNEIYPGLILNVEYNENVSEFINCMIDFEGNPLPLDSIGTGVLQTMQIFAYMEYFAPKILLLDEPDSHLHPTKQRLLAKEIQRRSSENTEMKVVFSTHSMQLLRSLSAAKTYHFINGVPQITDDESAVLLDIGALDADYLFSKPHLKYAIITEDRVDDVKDKKNFLKFFLQAHGLNENQFVLHSYNGCKNMHTAGVLQGLIQKHIPSAKVIVHIDRDQKWDENDADLLILKSKALSHNVKLFVTEFSEIENYFCQPAHIEHLYQIGLENAKKVYHDSIQENINETKRKVKDFILNERLALITDENGRIKSEELEKLVDIAISDHLEKVTPGKEILSKIRGKLQTDYSIHNLSRIVTEPTDEIKSSNFEKLLI